MMLVQKRSQDIIQDADVCLRRKQDFPTVPALMINGKAMKIINKLWHIIKGTIFNIIGKNKSISNERLCICNECEELIKSKIGNYCGICGCLLSSKTKVIEEHCPNDKW